MHLLKDIMMKYYIYLQLKDQNFERRDQLFHEIIK